jgi:hypothetical protein
MPVLIMIKLNKVLGLTFFLTAWDQKSPGSTYVEENLNRWRPHYYLPHQSYHFVVSSLSPHPFIFTLLFLITFPINTTSVSSISNSFKPERYMTLSVPIHNPIVKSLDSLLYSYYVIVDYFFCVY